MSILRSLAAGATSVVLAFGCGSGPEEIARIDSGWVDGGLDAGGGPGEAGDAHTADQLADAGMTGDGAARGPIATTPLDPRDPLLGGTTPPSGGKGCRKIDFLFVIDNSGSMEDEQQNLIRSFPGFISTIRSSVVASDHHVLVVDTDASGAGTSTSTSCSGDSCTCTPAESCCLSICSSRPGGTCNGTACGKITLPSSRCDGRLGAGRVMSASGGRCIPDSPRFVTSSTPDLSAKFSCMASVGTSGDGNERPMQAISEAIGTLARPGQCNAGFLRDDAILVVTFITDEEDATGQSPGGPAEWKAALVAAKQGNEAAVVVLGVFGDSDRAGSTCATGGLMGNLGAAPGYRLRSFVEGFQYGVAGSVCASDYNPFFSEAVGVIDSACDAFTN